MDRMNERRPVEKLSSNQREQMKLNKAKSLDSGYSLFQSTMVNNNVNNINSNNNNNGENKNINNQHQNNPTINIVNFNNNDMNYSLDETTLSKLTLSSKY